MTDKVDHPTLDAARTLLKLYGINATIIYYPHAYKHQVELCFGEKKPGRGSGRARKRLRYPKVINFKSPDTVYEGVKRLIMRANPVD